MSREKKPAMVAQLCSFAFALLACVSVTSHAQEGWHPPGVPFVCLNSANPYQPAESTSQVYIGVDNPRDAHDWRVDPVLVSTNSATSAGDTICERFSEYFHNHRADLKTAACHAEFDPSGPSARIYVNVRNTKFPRHPSGARMDWLDLSWGESDEIQARATTAQAECDEVLQFVRAYDARH